MAGSCNELGSEFQISGRRLKKPEYQKYCDETTFQFVNAGRMEMLVAGNFEDWHAADSEVPCRLVTKTPKNRHSKLVLHPL